MCPNTMLPPLVALRTLISHVVLDLPMTDIVYLCESY